MAEEYDITSALTEGRQDLEYSSSDNEELGSGNDLQDEILSDNEKSDEEDLNKENIEKNKSDKNQKSKQKPKEGFPSLELSDDEERQGSKVEDFFSNNTSVKKTKGGTFASFGLSKFLLNNVAKKGYRQPTPIQRKTIPLIIQDRDVVGMARTGSGKTAAFTLPLIEKLRSHSAIVGIRALILSPSRELALQSFRLVKEFSKGTDLRTALLIGGDSLDDQFSTMMSHPDIVVATPGRFMHLKVEMSLDLKTMEYVVYDEADRLFEMGFAEQLNELLASMPPSRQSLLFSATLPRSLVDFAKAGLSNPVLVRLDTESKVPDELQMAFFSTKNNEREANLLYIIQEIIKIPVASPEQLRKMEDSDKNQVDSDDENMADKKLNKKKKRQIKKESMPSANELPTKHSTVVFVPTRHHVEYISLLLRNAGYLVSFTYGSLDQHARGQQLYRFRSGMTSILVVTDVAARGLDIPILANVVNYTFPASSKIFVHRVGRTARAGNEGWAYSIISDREVPYLLDLELFLGKKVLLTSMHEQKCELLKNKLQSEYTEPKISYKDRLVLGSIPRVDLEGLQELFENILSNSYDLDVIRKVSFKAEGLYQRTRQTASQESLKRAKEILETGSWDEQHLLFGPNLEKEKEQFLAKLYNRNSKETVFEFHKKGKDKEEDSFVEFMNKRRRQIAPIQQKAKEKRELLDKERKAGLRHTLEDEILHADGEVGYNNAVIEADEDEIQNAFEDLSNGAQKSSKRHFRDLEYYLSHYAPVTDIQDQQLGIPTSFTNEANAASLDLDNDDKLQVNKQIIRWDKKKGKYVKTGGSDVKYITSENGQKIPASYKSGRFEEWKKQRNLHMGNQLGDGTPQNGSNKRFKHNKVKAPKRPDKYRDDYQKQKLKADKAVSSGMNVKGYHKPGDRDEVKSIEDIRKARAIKSKRKAKNARPSRKNK